MGNVESSIDGSLDGSEDSVSIGGSGETEIKESSEGSGFNSLLLSEGLDVNVLSGSFGDEVESLGH